MRKLISTVFLSTFLLFSMPVTTYAPTFTNDNLEQMFIDYAKRIVERQRQEQLKLFLDTIAYSESRKNPKAYNRYGYIGKYQFGYATRKATGFGHIKYWNFVNNPEIWSETDQDSAMIRLLRKNEEHLTHIISMHDSTVIRGTTITKSGILAAAHLAGAGNVKRYFSCGYNPRDAYGTSLESYLTRFSGFNF